MKHLEVTDIQRGCTHDGPGLRTTVFLKGCPLHCLWCHNPETRRFRKELLYSPEKCIGCMRCVGVCPVGAHTAEDGCHLFDPEKCVGCMACARTCPSKALEAASKTMGVEEVLAEVLEDRVFYRRRGGLTVSGGEPTAQPQGLLALLEGAKAQGIHTCLETCGVFPAAMTEKLVPLVDLFLYDVKDTDPARLKKNTGANLDTVLGNLRRIDELGGETVMRCVLIPEVNMTESHADGLAEIWKSLQNCQCVEILPYHSFGLSKAQRLGEEMPAFRIPEKGEPEAFAARLQAQGVPVKLHGSLLV